MHASAHHPRRRRPPLPLRPEAGGAAPPLATKLLPGLALAGLLTLAPGCDRTSSATTTTAPAPAPSAASAPGEAAFDIRVGEEFRFSPDRFECRPGQPLRLRLVNTLAPDGPELRHNAVLLRPGTDVEAFALAGADANAAHDYVPETFSGEVLAHSPLVAPGRTFELVLVAPRSPGDYPLVCTFPGHCILGMRGTLVVR